jgi:methionyl-tRNA formyltransferase
MAEPPDRRIVFAGTPEFAVPALEALISSDRWRPIAVLTQPDRPAGRGRRLRPGPVKQHAVAAGIDVLQPRTLRAESAYAELAALRPDLIVTAAYGLLLPRSVLELPGLGCWNLHASLLPRWRGASPINQAILAGDETTGISLMRMDAGLDTGPVILQRAIGIGTEETAGQLHDRLAALAAEVLTDALERLDAGRLPEPRPQDPAGATHAPLIAKRDARLDWSQPAGELERRVRAFHPWPVAFAEIDGDTYRIHRARRVDAQGPPGRILDSAGSGRLVVGCGDGALEILELQAPGRQRISARDWLNARRA